MEEYVFPKNNWYIEITDENKEVLNDWRIKQNYSDSLYNNPQYKYVYFDGGAGGSRFEGWDFVFEINFDQFKKYVLKEEQISIIVNEDLSYLISLFKELDIV
jgi:hypothetical protein